MYIVYCIFIISITACSPLTGHPPRKSFFAIHETIKAVTQTHIHTSTDRAKPPTINY